MVFAVKKIKKKKSFHSIFLVWPYLLHQYRRTFIWNELKFLLVCLVGWLGCVLLCVFGFFLSFFFC